MPDSTPSKPATLRPHSARLSLGESAPAVSTHEHLRFQLDHALARDAVHTPLDVALLTEGLLERHLTPIALSSASSTRAVYLRRPDLGRTLSSGSVHALQGLVDPSEAQAAGETSGEKSGKSARIAIILADGLSALALEHHALPLLDALLPSLSSLLSPLIPVITNARVAIGDEVGALLHADLTLLLIGERPGLSSPDSLGAYITWQPRLGRSDAERNCISNIRAEGLSYAEAAHRIAYYIDQAFKLRTTGIALKDPDTTTSQLDTGA